MRKLVSAVTAVLFTVACGSAFAADRIKKQDKAQKQQKVHKNDTKKAAPKK